MLPTNYPNLKKACVSFRISDEVRVLLVLGLIYTLSMALSILQYRHMNNCPLHGRQSIAGQFVWTVTPVMNTFSVLYEGGAYMHTHLVIDNNKVIREMLGVDK
jgi:hypothetical protein